MFAYCGNNPINRVDPTGNSWLVFAAIALGVAVITAIDHYLAENYPEGVALESVTDNSSESEYGFCSEGKMIYAEGSGANVDQNGATLFDTKAGVYEATNEFNDGTKIALAKICTAEAVANMDFSFGFSGEISGYAALYSTDFSAPIKLGNNITIEVSGSMYFGSVSGGIEWDLCEGSIAVSSPSVGSGYKVGVDLDWN